MQEIYVYVYVLKGNNSPCRTQSISLKEHIGDNTTLEPIPLRTTTMKHTNHKTTIKVITQMARVIRKLSRDSTEYAHVYTETYTAITPYNHQNSIEAAHTYSPFTCGSNNNTQITTIKPHTKGYKQAATFPQAQPNNLARTNISYVERMRSLQ